MQSSLDESAVRQVAHLARLEVSDDEVREYAVQLSAVLGYFQQLGDVDTSHVSPTAHALPVSNVFREDAVAASLEQGDALGNAPARQEGFFRVPKVLDQESS